MGHYTRKIQTATFGVPEYEMKSKQTYRPPISAEHMRRFRLLKLESGKPITKLIDDAIQFYFDNCVDMGKAGG